MTDPPIVRKLEEQLDYRLPNSGKPMSSVVFPRAEAEQLLREIRRLQEVERKTAELEMRVGDVLAETERQRRDLVELRRLIDKKERRKLQ